jgi:hypothetical protein
MAHELEELIDDLSSVPIKSKASLAADLVESPDETVDEEVASLWLEEIGRRDAQLRDGTVTPKSVDQVMREARALFGWKTVRRRER